MLLSLRPRVARVFVGWLISDVADSDNPIDVEQVRAGFEAFGRGDWQFV